MKHIITIIMALLYVQGHAQNKFNTQSRWTVSAEAVTQTTGVYAESYRLPGLRTQLSGGKGLQIGGEYAYVTKRHGHLYQLFNLQYFGSKQENGSGATTALGYRHGIARFFVEGQAGVGYLQTTFSRDRDLQNEHGDFFSERFRIGGLTPMVAIGAGYQMTRHCRMYLRYYHHAQLGNDFSPDGLRLHRHLNLGFGWRF